MFSECRDCAHREVGQNICNLALVGSEIGGCSAFVATGEQGEGGNGQGQGYESDSGLTTSPISDPIPEISTTVVLKDKEETEETVELRPTQEIQPNGVVSEEGIGTPDALATDDPEPSDKDKN